MATGTQGVSAASDLESRYMQTEASEISRLTVVSREAKEEVPCDGLSTKAREYFTRTNLVKIKITITYEP